MNLHRHPELLDRLAAEYALGTMHGGARRRFQALMRQHVVVTQAVARWDERLTPMTAQLPESYVGVLATADGRQGLIVSSLRRGRALDLKVIQAVPVPAGSVAVLWTLDAQGRPQAVGPLPPLPAGGFVSVALPRVADELFARAVELAVSVEPAGSLPAQPGSAYVYRGLCGKLWKLPPAR